MSQIVKTDPQGSQPTRWSPPSLNDKLTALLDGYTNLMAAPVIGPKSAAALQAMIDAPADWPMPDRSSIERMLALLATVKRRRQNSSEEAAAQIELYWTGLRDVPLPDLHHAYDVLLKGSPWFPDISEIREAAEGGPVARHRRKRLIASALIDRHRREWQPQTEPTSPETLKAVKDIADDFLRRKRTIAA